MQNFTFTIAGGRLVTSKTIKICNVGYIFACKGANPSRTSNIICYTDKLRQAVNTEDERLPKGRRLGHMSLLLTQSTVTR